MRGQSKPRPTQARLKEVLNYDPVTGIFTRKIESRTGPKDRKYGRIGAGRINEFGYVMVMVDGVNYIAGSLAWLYVNGEWPHARIKYINGDKIDNRIENIRVQDADPDDIKSSPMTLERLKQLVHYDPVTGWFTWCINTSVAKVGERVGSGHGLGYRQIGLDYKKYLEHSLAVFYMTGKWPENEVDHINGDKSDNRWANLREVTRSENGHNKGLHRRNTTGFPGVAPHGNKFKARIDVSPVKYDLGWYKTIAEARVARLLGEKKYFGTFTTWKADRDGAIPIGEQFLSLMVRGDSLFVIGPDGSPFEVTDASQIETVDEVDHIDGDANNNEVSNLRVITRMKRFLH